MTKKGHTCDSCTLKPLSENNCFIDWDFNTGDLIIQVQPSQYNLRDAGKDDFNTLSAKEIQWRAEFEQYRTAIIDAFNKYIKEH